MTATELPVLHVTGPAWRAVLDGSPILPVDGRRCEACGGTGKDPLAASVVDSVFGLSSDWARDCSDCHGRGVLPPVLSGRIAVATPCLDCGGHGWDAEPHPSTGEPINPRPCRSCDGLGALIVATATAEEVLPVVDDIPPQESWDKPWAVVTVRPWVTIHRWKGYGSAEGDYLGPNTLDLRPGGWVVLLSDAAPTTERCPFGHDEPPRFRAEDIDSDAPLDGTRLAADIAATVPEANRELRRAEWRAEIKARTRTRRKCRFCMFGEPVPVESAPAGTVTTWEAG